MLRPIDAMKSSAINTLIPTTTEKVPALIESADVVCEHVVKDACRGVVQRITGLKSFSIQAR